MKKNTRAYLVQADEAAREYLGGYDRLRIAERLVTACRSEAEFRWGLKLPRTKFCPHVTLLGTTARVRFEGAHGRVEFSDIEYRPDEETKVITCLRWEFT